MTENTKEELETLIRARYPISWVQTHEEERVLKIIQDVAKEQDKVPAVWTITRGMWDLKEDRCLDQTQDPVGALDFIMKNALPEGAIFVLPDYHRFLQDVVVSRKLRDLHAALKETRKSVVIISPIADIPIELQKAICVLDLNLPTAEDLAAVLDDAMEGMRMRADTDPSPNVKEFLPKLEKAYKSRDALVQAGLGLTLSEYENVIAKCLVLHDLSVKVIKGEKRQIIRKNGSLEYFDPDEGMGEIGGLDCLKEWTRKAKKRYTSKAEEYGLSKPKGVLLVGPPGTGKSLSAKAISNTLQLPLIRLDMSDTASKYYGETASNVKAALKVVNTVAPAVFWWDEVEKMFSTGAGGEGHEETMRALGTLLTDFEESTAPVLRVATCNAVQNLKPEFMQRFERIFFVDLPNPREREEIFTIHLRKVHRDPKNYDLAALAQITNGFVGREIRTIIMEALANAFDEDREMTTKDMIAEANRTTPMSSQKKDEIERMRNWAKANALPASTPDTEKSTKRKVRDLEI